MSSATPLCALAAVALLAAAPVDAAISGGGSPKRDCHAEFVADGYRLNFPTFDPARPRPPREVRCFDGEVGCDQDGAVNGSCRFDLDVCLHVADPGLPLCAPAPVEAVEVSAAPGDAELTALQSELDALLPAASLACTDGLTVTLPLGADGKGRPKRSRRVVKLRADTPAGRDADALRLSCVPRGWPSHGFDHRNTRANPLETALSPANAAALELAWAFDLRQIEGGVSNAVTSTPTVGFGKVFFGSWNGNVYAVDAKRGKLRWKYDVDDGFLGVQGSVTLAADGRAFVGDSAAVVHALDVRNGRLLWKTPVGNPAVDHLWGSPTVVGERVFVGVASHSDNPCTRGRLVALAIDTGAVLWTLHTVPERICNNDTSVECSIDADCGAGSCVAARGAGVTATVAFDPEEDAVYMNTVGCYTFPSVGDSDSMFKVDAATGGVLWKTRVQPPEQFNACNNDGSIDCTSDGDCPPGGSCLPKLAYHDFGFINGPLVVEADDGVGGLRRLVVSGSKDGTLYAFDPATGGVVWANPVLPAPVTPAFAGFGLFNGAVAFAEQRFHAALFEFVPPTAPPYDHLMAFSAVDGAMLWSDEIGASWGHVSLAGGVLFTGTQSSNEVFVYDAASGVRLDALTVPGVGTRVSAGAAIVDGRVYVAYGVGGAEGGVQAYALP